MAQKTYTDPAGQMVPAQYVPAYDKLRDQIAQRIAKRWQDEEKRLAKVKAETIADIDKLLEAAAKEANVNLGGEKGNCQFRSFDGTITIGRDRQYHSEFDERFKFAQQLIMEAVKEMNEQVKSLVSESNSKAAELISNVQNLSEISTRAFTPRRNGKIDNRRIRELKTYKVDHPKWHQAIDLLNECERTVAYRDYIRVAVRHSPDAKPTAIILDIASL